MAQERPDFSSASQEPLAQKSIGHAESCLGVWVGCCKHLETALDDLRRGVSMTQDAAAQRSRLEGVRGVFLQMWIGLNPLGHFLGEALANFRAGLIV
ncbi:MAG TPA: hypothetical protein DDZ76_02590 [Xanthomonadales bacterium]|nr:hypothetical protein [Xanthomonadales bacterium]